MESKRTFKIQVVPIVENAVIEDLDGEITGNDILDKYAAVAAKRYTTNEKDIRDTLIQVIPFTPVGPAPDGTPIVCCGKNLTYHLDSPNVGQGVVRTTLLKNMYSGKQNRDELNKGLCLVSVSHKHPVYNLVNSYGEELKRSAMLEAKVAVLEKAITEQGPLQGEFSILAVAHYANMCCLEFSNADQPDKPKKKKKKKKRSKAAIIFVEGMELTDLL